MKCLRVPLAGFANHQEKTRGFFFLRLSIFSGDGGALPGCLFSSFFPFFPFPGGLDMQIGGARINISRGE
jgi:hypothetical protein